MDSRKLHQEAFLAPYAFIISYLTFYLLIKKARIGTLNQCYDTFNLWIAFANLDKQLLLYWKQLCWVQNLKLSTQFSYTLPTGVMTSALAPTSIKWLDPNKGLHWLAQMDLPWMAQGGGVEEGNGRGMKVGKSHFGADGEWNGNDQVWIRIWLGDGSAVTVHSLS